MPRFMELPSPEGGQMYFVNLDMIRYLQPSKTKPGNVAIYFDDSHVLNVQLVGENVDKIREML